MAILKTPLLSFSARGKIAKTLVFMGWKGLNTVRQYVVPANPQTTAQTVQRDLLTDIVAAWRNFFVTTSGRDAWMKQAGQESSPMSGFNSFTRNAIGIAASNADGSFADAITAVAGKKMRFAVLNLDDGAAGDEAGNFEFWSGTKPGSLLKISDVAIAAGNVDGVSLETAGYTVYGQIRKDGFNRSGIGSIVLLA
jgi:hypothetical protein